MKILLVMIQSGTDTGQMLSHVPEQAPFIREPESAIRGHTTGREIVGRCFGETLYSIL